MKISGERPVDAGNKWQRFRLDLQAQQGCELNRVHAKFEKGILTVTMPKTIAPKSTPAPKDNSIAAAAPPPPPPPPSSDPDRKPTQGAAAPPPPPSSAPDRKPTQGTQPSITKIDTVDKPKEPLPKKAAADKRKEPTVAAGPLVCPRPESGKHGGRVGGFVYRYRKAAMGVMVAAAVVAAGIYVIYKYGIFEAKTEV